MGPPDASSRPSRLGPLAHFVVIGALLLSFFSGLLVWYGQTIAEGTLLPPPWLRGCRAFHGILNPVLCAVFGYLVCQHIRYGWELRVNRVSGFLMEGTFLVLIASSLALYYADEGALRTACVWIHRILGAALPAVLIGHWLAARAWVRKNF